SLLNMEDFPDDIKQSWNKIREKMRTQLLFLLEGDKLPIKKNDYTIERFETMSEELDKMFMDFKNLYNENILQLPEKISKLLDIQSNFPYLDSILSFIDQNVKDDELSETIDQYKLIENDLNF